jgi:ribonuclease BN (tRNA processing enzyme)
MKVRVPGAHNCESKKTRLVTLLIDDVLALDAGGLTSSLTFKAQQKIKAILITHAHYDHIRDIPSLAMNSLLHEKRMHVYATQEVYDALATHILNGTVYAEFFKKPVDNPVIKFTLIKPLQKIGIDGYDVLPVPVAHSLPAVGYLVTSPDGKTLFYTGDTGPGLSECWQYISPQLLIIETTAPNRYEEFGKKNRHLTPSLLKAELLDFRKMKGYLPQVVLVHMNPNPEQEKQLAEEITALAQELHASITPGYEGMRIAL